jgi:hypothetical protein
MFAVCQCLLLAYASLLMRVWPQHGGKARYLGHIQGTFRTIQGTFRTIQGTFRTIQGTF